MRRGINIRKKKRIILKDTNKKALQLLILLSIVLIVCVIIYVFFIQNFFIKKSFEKDSIGFSNLNETIPFSLNKIILFSSATANTNDINHSVLSLNISQYCDIGMYINNTNKENTSINSLYINNISISTPELGTPCLYKKKVEDLGKCSFDENSIIQNEFYFNVIDSNIEINYDNYEIYNNGSTPISLGFYNKDVKKDFLTDATEIGYNGALLNMASIPQTSLKCNVSFTINIITNSDEHYICNVNFDIPFEDEEGSIYNDGYFTKEISSEETSKFMRIK